MKRKIIGLCVCMLVIATAVPAVESLKDLKDNNIITSTEKNSAIQPLTPIAIPSMLGGNVIFSQPPYPSDEPWQAYTSSSIFPYLCQDDFWQFTGAFDSVHWWGLVLIYDSGWKIGDPNGMLFEIKIYRDTGGSPGPVVATYSNVAPLCIATGLNYSTYPLYYFEAGIARLSLTNGWISIQSTSSPSGSALLWMNSLAGNNNSLQDEAQLNANLAFELTQKAVPDLTCDGSLGWTQIKPGDLVADTFQVGNIGENGSLLSWEVVSWPAWGTWTFAPASGIGLAQGGWVTVTAMVVAPSDKNTNYTGTVKLVNVNDPSDFYEINVYLKTPCSYRYSFLEQFFEKFPNAFPFLQHALGY
jgi:hypothetical protein